MKYQAPRHIKTIQVNETLRISLRAGFQLDPITKNTMAVALKRRSARGYSRTIFLCNVIENDTESCTLTVNFQEPVNNDHFIATIKYTNILHAQVYLPNSAPIQKAEYSPGDVAFGSTSFGTWSRGSEQYVTITF
jgi:hypothetical protein